MSKRRAALLAVSRRRTKSRQLDALRALRDFLRGFTGLAQLGDDPESVRHALEQRATRRKSCC
ncbi:MAG: hypothetical protein ACREI8_02290 [Myxococcota bacterium]